VRVDYVETPDGYGGYKIAVAEKNDAIRARGAKFIDRYQESIDQLVFEFGKLPTKDLELRATIVYADRDAMRSSKSLGRDEFVGLVKKVKPRFSEPSISEALSELESNHHVTQRA
jgi:hypothetical protein